MLVQGLNPNHLTIKNHQQFTRKVFPSLTHDHLRNFLQNGVWNSEGDISYFLEDALDNSERMEKSYTTIKLPLYCKCRRPSYGGSEMVLCDGDGCENEFHLWCIEYDPVLHKEKKFYCNACQPKPLCLETKSTNELILFIHSKADLFKDLLQNFQYPNYTLSERLRALEILGEETFLADALLEHNQIRENFPDFETLHTR